MAKQKSQATVANRHLYSRASYLYQAAHYFAQLSEVNPNPNKPQSHHEIHSTQKSGHPVQRAAQNLSRQMISDSRIMSQKGQVRQSAAMKRNFCKLCDTVLIEGQSCRSIVENPSKGGRKPWADMLVTECLTCGGIKRFPICAQKQKRKHLRETVTAQPPAKEAVHEDAKKVDLTSTT